MQKLEFLLKEPVQKVLKKRDIEEILAHRDPFLLVDEVHLLEEQRFFLGLRQFSGAEDFFKGHFPKYPVVPGVLILEIMAQTTGAAIMQSPDLKGRIAFFMSVDYAKFRKQVVPGDTLKIAVEVLRSGKITKIYAEAYTHNGLCTEAQLNFILGDKE